MSSRDQTDYGRERFVNKNQHEFFIKTGIHPLSLGHHKLSFQGLYQNQQVDLDVNSKVPVCSSSFKADCAVLGTKLYTFKKSVTIQRSMLYLSDDWLASTKHQLSFAALSGYDAYLNRAFIEPRLAWHWLPVHDIHLKISGGMYSGFPDALQMVEPIGSQTLTFEKSTQLAVDISKVLESGWRISSTIYYKLLNDLIFVQKLEADERSLSNKVEGEAYGIDLMLEKHAFHQLNGWIALSLSKTQRANPETNKNLLFQYDKPFNLKTA